MIGRSEGPRQPSRCFGGKFGEREHGRERGGNARGDEDGAARRSHVRY